MCGRPKYEVLSDRSCITKVIFLQMQVLSAMSEIYALRKLRNTYLLTYLLSAFQLKTASKAKHARLVNLYLTLSNN